MKLKLNDKVLVISGKDKGKTGRITRVVTKQNRVVVEKVNIRTKHIKKSQQGPGQIIRYEAPVSISNVMILDPVQNKPTRISYKMLDNGKKERISKISGASLDNIVVTETAEKPKKKETAAVKEKKSKKQTIKA
jgi:large subunit ribosomal protein L24